MRNNWIRSCCSRCTAQRVVLAVVVLVAGTAGALAQGRAPVPDDAALSKAQALLGEVYGKEHGAAKTSDEKTAFAKKMLEQAAETKGDPAGRFVLLRVAKDVAGAAGDVETAFEAVNRLAATYDVDAIEMKQKTFRAAAKAARMASQFKVLHQRTKKWRWVTAGGSWLKPQEAGKRRYSCSALVRGTGKPKLRSHPV